MSIRTTIDAPDIRPDTIGPEHLRSDPGSLGKITGEALRLFGDSIVIGTGKSLAHGSTVIVGSDAKIPWSVLKGYPSIIAGTGLQGTGTLSGDITLSVDSTVVRTTGNYTLSGSITISDNTLLLSGSTSAGGKLVFTGFSPRDAMDLGDNRITNVNRLVFSGPGTNQGIEWAGGSGWKVYEAPDTLGSGAGNLQFVTGSSRRFTVTTAGDVWFAGTLTGGTVPWARLSGHPSITAGTGLTGGGSLSTSRTLSVVYGSTAGTAVEGNTQITITAGTNLSGGGTITLGAGGSVALSVVSNPTFSTSVTTPLLTHTGTLTLHGAGSSGIIAFQTNSAERMRIDPAGRVGIGTIAPAYTLHVAGDIGFTGTLQQGTVPWTRLSGIPSASTSQAGIVQLNNTVTSTSTTQAATANAVKQAYDLAATKVSKSGDTMTGPLRLAGQHVQINRPDTTGGWARGLHLHSKDGSTTEAGIGFYGSGDAPPQHLYIGFGSSPWGTSSGLTVSSSSIAFKGNTVWHAGNDGSGSGLDADLLDGQHGSYYRNASNLNAGNLNIARMPTGGNWSLSSNLTIDTSTLAIDITNDRVGIGTASPAYKLDVAGDVRFTGTLQGGTVPWARLSGVPTASTSQAGIVQLNDSVTSTATNQAATANAVKTAYDAAVARVAKSGDTMTGNLMFSGGTRYIGTSDSNNFVIRTANTDRITIASNGNVGIGTTSPSYRLHVSGDVGFTGTLQAGTVPWARLSGVPTASTSQAGIVQLNNTVTSTSTTQAATANAVKQAYDLADSKVSKAGDTMTGKLTAPSYGSVDTRSTPTSPGDYKSEMRLQFKYLSSIGLNGIASGTYCQLVGYRAWSDDSGGRAHEVAFTDGGDIYYRNGTQAGGWGPWQKLWHSGNDGSGSGLDADLLDGQHGSYYAKASDLDAHRTSGDHDGRYVRRRAGAANIWVQSATPSGASEGDIWIRL